MALFEKKEVKEARRQAAIRMGKKRVQNYTRDCRRMSGRYMELAKKALALGEQAQCDQYLCRRIQYDRQANKWEAFSLKMEDLTLRGQMSGAMKGLMGGMQALTREIRANVSMKEMTSVVSELNLTMTQLEQTEEQLSSAMDNLDYDVGTPMSDSSDVDIPDELRNEVGRMRSELLDEVVVEGKTGMKGGISGTDVDSRINEGLERIRNARKQG